MSSLLTPLISIGLVLAAFDEKSSQRQVPQDQGRQEQLSAADVILGNMANLFNHQENCFKIHKQELIVLIRENQSQLTDELRKISRDLEDIKASISDLSSEFESLKRVNEPRNTNAFVPSAQPKNAGPQPSNQNEFYLNVRCNSCHSCSSNEYCPLGILRMLTKDIEANAEYTKIKGPENINSNNFLILHRLRQIFMQRFHKPCDAGTTCRVCRHINSRPEVKLFFFELDDIMNLFDNNAQLFNSISYAPFANTGNLGVPLGQSNMFNVLGSLPMQNQIGNTTYQSTNMGFAPFANPLNLGMQLGQPNMFNVLANLPLQNQIGNPMNAGNANCPSTSNTCQSSATCPETAKKVQSAYGVSNAQNAASNQPKNESPYCKSKASSAYGTSSNSPYD